MHIITGLGRSGTSFIAEIFSNLGYDMGTYNEHVDAGFENPEISSINKTIMNGDYWPVTEQVERMRSISTELFIAKDPRWIITLGTWIQNACKIDSVIFCQRDYDEIIRSSDKTVAGTMAMFAGWPVPFRKVIMSMLETGCREICAMNNIPADVITFPLSLCDFNAIRCLDNIVHDEQKLYEAWKKTIRKPAC